MNQPSHWLTRPETIRRLWVGFALVLALTVAAQLRFEAHGHFAMDGIFGFHAWYGFGTCVVMIFFAKLLGLGLKRPDTYYDE